MATRKQRKAGRRRPADAPPPPPAPSPARPSPAAPPAAPAVAAPWAPTPLDATDRRHAALTGAGFGLLYGLTACRTFSTGDSPELAMALALTGIPHPPGYPLFVLLASPLVRLLPLDPALAANLVTGWCGAGAVALAGLLARRLGAGVVASWSAALALGLGVTAWSAAVAAEVYAFDLLLLTVVLHAALGVPAGLTRRVPAAVWAGAAVGAWLGHRPINVVYLPAVLALGHLAGAWTGGPLPGAGAPWRRWTLGGAVSGLVFLFLPLRSAMNPRLDIGDPESWDRFLVVVRGAPYTRHWFAGPWELGLGRIERHLQSLPVELGALALLAPIAVASGWLRGGPARQRALALLGLPLAGWAVALGYHVLDIAVYFLPATLGLALLGALALSAALAGLERQGGTRAAVAPVVALLAPAVLLPVNLAEADRSDARLARRLAEDIVASAPADGVVLVGGDTSIHGLWYLQAVEGKAPGLVVLSPGHMHPWYYEQLVRQYPGDAWPPWDGAVDQATFTRRVVDALERRRPILATQSVPLQPYLEPHPPHPGRAMAPRGVLRQLVPQGASVDVEAFIAQAERMDAMLGALTPLAEPLQIDEESLVLEYAMGGIASAELLERAQRWDAAERLYRRVLAFEPDQRELAVALDVKEGLGQAIPELGIEARARIGLLRAQAGRAAPPLPTQPPPPAPPGSGPTLPPGAVRLPPGPPAGPSGKPATLPPTP